MTSQVSSVIDRVRRRDLRILDRGPLAYTYSSLAHYGLRAVMGKRRVREREFIEREYHGDTRSEYWKDDISSEELIFGDDASLRWILRDGRPTLGTVREAREYLLRRLAHWVEQIVLKSPGRRVVEFGCGTGRNLIFLARKYPELHLTGIELTASTVARAKAMAQSEKLNIQFIARDMCGELDLQTADLAFSIHALEQLPRDFPLAIENMLRVSEHALLIEPVQELWPLNALTLASRFRLRLADYLNGLPQYVKKLPDTEILFSEFQPYALNAVNPGVELLLHRARANR